MSDRSADAASNRTISTTPLLPTIPTIISTSTTPSHAPPIMAIPVNIGSFFDRMANAGPPFDGTSAFSPPSMCSALFPPGSTACAPTYPSCTRWPLHTNEGRPPAYSDSPRWTGQRFCACGKPVFQRSTQATAMGMTTMDLYCQQNPCCLGNCQQMVQLLPAANYASVFCHPQPTHRQQEVQIVLQSMQQEDQRIGNWLRNIEVNREAIKNVYYEKRLMLKEHYEAINQAVTASIKADLQAVERQERLDLTWFGQEWQRAINDQKMLRQGEYELTGGLNQLLAELPDWDYTRVVGEMRGKLETAVKAERIRESVIRSTGIAAAEMRARPLSSALGYEMRRLYDQNFYRGLPIGCPDQALFFSFQKRV